jgi:hypothetical protein
MQWKVEKVDSRNGLERKLNLNSYQLTGVVLLKLVPSGSYRAKYSFTTAHERQITV